MEHLICRCTEKGCEHLMSWHRAESLVEARCLVPGCFCITTQCEHAENADKPKSTQDDKSFLLALGITN